MGYDDETNRNRINPRGLGSEEVGGDFIYY